MDLLFEGPGMLMDAAGGLFEGASALGGVAEGASAVGDVAEGAAVVGAAGGIGATMMAIAPAAIIKGVVSGGIKAAIPAFLAKKVTSKSNL